MGAKLKFGGWKGETKPRKTEYMQLPGREKEEIAWGMGYLEK